MGFPEESNGEVRLSGKFIELIMGCICDPSFDVLVNGTPMSWFECTMGLRQGDPLSPYLFILGADVLTWMIKRKQGQGSLTELPLGDRQGHLGHLLYADDCLLLAKATTSKAEVVNKVLHDYCCMSSKQVNIAKSQVIFCEVVSPQQ